VCTRQNFIAPYWFCVPWVLSTHYWQIYPCTKFVFFASFSPTSHLRLTTRCFWNVSEREYRCLGQWSENGLVYTYTYRRDVGTYECFVGEIVSNTEIFIKEAGEHCARGSEPLNSGMKLERNGKLWIRIRTPAHTIESEGQILSHVVHLSLPSSAKQRTRHAIERNLTNTNL